MLEKQGKMLMQGEMMEALIGWREWMKGRKGNYVTTLHKFDLLCVT